MKPGLRQTYNIPVEATLDVIGGKWKTLSLCHLTYGSKRTNELKKNIPEITQKMLTQQLRELEEDGVITRTIYNQVPPKVVYELSELGESLKPIVDLMCDIRLTWESASLPAKRSLTDSNRQSPLDKRYNSIGSRYRPSFLESLG
ncbi:winged helix-turn-helix transcriptional regulator [Cohnella terricola]|uniref:Helix-turn-helix transcriptional regulator n=1 Tax=Cohnella terricola TaxID=1289167 RepID=A0A559JWA0_9BACL|nr:helix-turn-helix domain-containing protein [Cohnella terricola]TVY04159.1 helix-turn-helix transcriptional regulator [Cohnella terricola]